MSYRQTQGKYFDCFLLSFRSTVKYYKNTDRSKPSLISRGVGGKQKGKHSIGVTVLDSTRQVYNLGNGGVPVHHDPVDGIVPNHEKWQWGLSPFSISGVCDNPVHRVMVNWDPPTPAGWRQVAGAGSDHDGTRNMSQGVNLLYLFRYQIGGGMAVLSHGFFST